MGTSIAIAFRMKGGGDMMVTYEQHLEFLIRNVEGSRAELQGFRDAKSFDKLMVWSQDKYLQNRYADGYQTGKEKLKAEQLMKG